MLLEKPSTSIIANSTHDKLPTRAPHQSHIFQIYQSAYPDVARYFSAHRPRQLLHSSSRIHWRQYNSIALLRMTFWFFLYPTIMPLYKLIVLIQLTAVFIGFIACCSHLRRSIKKLTICPFECFALVLVYLLNLSIFPRSPHQKHRLLLSSSPSYWK